MGGVSRKEYWVLRLGPRHFASVAPPGAQNVSAAMKWLTYSSALEGQQRHGGEPVEVHRLGQGRYRIARGEAIDDG